MAVAVVVAELEGGDAVVEWPSPVGVLLRYFLAAVADVAASNTK